MDRSTILGCVLAFFEPEIRAWRGEQPLRKVFWGYGVLTSSGIGLLYALSIYADRVRLEQALLPCIAGYTFWLLVSIWRCSRITLNPLWGALARRATVVWAANTILVLTFLQLELIGKYLEVSSATMAP